MNDTVGDALVAYLMCDHIYVNVYIQIQKHVFLFSGFGHFCPLYSFRIHLRFEVWVIRLYFFSLSRNISLIHFEIWIFIILFVNKNLITVSSLWFRFLFIFQFRRLFPHGIWIISFDGFNLTPFYVNNLYILWLTFGEFFYKLEHVM